MKSYRQKTILVTGGRGYIGSALVQSLATLDCRLILLDQSPPDLWMPGQNDAEICLKNGDVSKRETWQAVLPGVDYVFHLAAREYHYRSDYTPEADYQSNALPILHLLEVCRLQHYRPVIVFASSANLFGLADTMPVNEGNADDPLTVWALHKQLAEKYLTHYADQFGIQSVVLRLANVYGPTARWSVTTRMTVNKVIARALAGMPLVTYHNRQCIRDYVFLEDVVQALLLAGTLGDTGRAPFFVLGSGEGVTIQKAWEEIAASVESHTGHEVSIQYDKTVAVEPVEQRNFVADTTRFKRMTGWRPQTDFRQGIDHTVRALMSRQGTRQVSEITASAYTGG